MTERYADSAAKRVASLGVRFFKVETSEIQTLVRLYQDILEPSFSPEQRATEKAFLTDQQSEGACAIIARDNKGDLVAGLTAHYYSTCRICLINYCAVKDGFRGRGIGSALLRYGGDRWFKELAPILFLGEIEDPREHRDTESQRRFKLHARRGCRVLRLPFLQPALEATGVRVRGILLVVDPASHNVNAETTTVAGSPLDCFIREYFVKWEGHLSDDDTELQLLLSHCRRTEGVPLLPAGALPPGIPEGGHSW